MRPTVSPPRFFAALSILATCLFPGCSGDAEAPEADAGAASAGATASVLERAARSAFRRIDFHADPVGSRSAAVTPRILARQELDGDKAPWTAQASGGSKIRGIFEDDRHEKRIPGLQIDAFRMKKSITGPVPESARGFSQVVVEMTVLDGNQDNVSLEFLADGEVLLPAPVVVVKWSRSVQIVSFTVPELRQLAVEPDSFRLSFKGNSQLAVIVSVSFVEVPLAAFLIDDEGDGRSVLVGEVFRRSEHLTTDAVSTADVALDAGEEIALYLAADPRVVRPTERLTCDVSVEMQDGTATRSIEVDAASGWTPVRFNADELQTGEARILIRTSSSIEGGVGVALVGEASIRDAATQGGDPTAELPVVLLITSDTHRGDHLGIVNAESPVLTPHLDALARRGVLFDNCYSQTNVTNPSHIGLMTGLHPRDTGILDNRTRLAQRAHTLAEQFSSNGYETFASTSAFHLLDEHSGLGQGFDRMEGPLRLQRDGEIAIDHVMGWIDACADAPVFAWVHLFDAHEPYEPPAPFNTRYWEEGDDPFHGERTPGIPESVFDGLHKDLKDASFPISQYRGEVDYLDGALFGLLHHPRVLSGITAFTADHGEAFGQHGIWWDHAGLYPDTVHIPLILAWPGAPAGERVSAPVQQIDVGRTLLNLAGLEDVDFEGRDLRWAIETPEAANPRFMLASHAMTASIEVDGWHMVMELRRNHPRAYEKKRLTGEIELFHRAIDPLCENNVLMDNLPRAKAMRAALIEWLNSGPAEGLGENQSRSESDEAMLAALGYGGDSESSKSTKHWDPLRWEKNRWEHSQWRMLFED